MSTVRNPWVWVPTLYFAEGIPYVVVNNISVIMLKRMGMANGDVALFTGLLYLPWFIKPLWSPFVDILRTKRWWTVTMQLLMAVAFATLVAVLPEVLARVSGIDCVAGIVGQVAVFAGILSGVAHPFIVCAHVYGVVELVYLPPVVIAKCLIASGYDTLALVFT